MLIILNGVKMSCDVKGCHRLAYVEVYPMNGAWNYLCKKHYREEYKKYGNKHGWYELSMLEKILVVIRVYR